jgi:predicted dehydrogenase
MLKSAFLGCGPRARAHARSYQFVSKGRAVAACDRHPEKREAFCRDFGIERSYADLHEMLENEKPDLLHVVTLPTLRVDPLTIASEHHVPVVLVEKPIAVSGEDYRALLELSKRTATRILVNTQLHFHSRNLELKRDVAEGRIGDVRFIDVSARSTILDQGVHVLELAHSYNSYAKPTSVFAAVSGAKTLSSKQPSVDTATATVAFANGVRAELVTGYHAPRAGTAESVYHHKRIAVYGTKGFVHWTMASWERFTPEGGYESGTHDYTTEDDLAQGVLTDSAFELCADPSRAHGTSLEHSLTQFLIILGAYVSALDRRPVELPFDPPDRLLERLKRELSEGERGEPR